MSDMDDYINVFDSDVATDVGSGNIPPKWYPSETSLDDGTIVVKLVERLASQKEDWPDTWIVATSDGRLLRLPTQTRIRRAVKNMEAGTYLRIVYQGDAKLKTGPGTFKNYEIKILDSDEVKRLGWDFEGTPQDEDVALQVKKSAAYKATSEGGGVEASPTVQALGALKEAAAALPNPKVSFVTEVLKEAGVTKTAEDFLKTAGIPVEDGRADIASLLS